MSAAPLLEGQGEDRVIVHANALILGSAAALLRGPSGSGKSGLCLELIHMARERGVFARLIGDDRVEILHRHGRLVARPHPVIAGAIEDRGVGILPVAFEPAGVLRCLVDLRGPGEGEPPRCPEEADGRANICGVALPRLAADAGEAGAARKIFSFIHQFAAF